MALILYFCVTLWLLWKNLVILSSYFILNFDMAKSKKIKKFPGNNIFLNVVAIGIAGVLLLVLTLLFLNVYTRHGQNIIVPDLSGLQADEAEAILRSKGLEVQIIDSIYQADAVPGSVIEQTPRPGNKVKEGRSIYLTIYSLSPQQVSVPELVDFSTRQAVSLLNSIGFNDIDIVEVPAEYHGLVISLEYKGRKLITDEQVPVGSPLRLIVGSGIMNDSIDVNDEYILSPDGNRINSGSDTSGSGEKKSDMDDSFF